MALVFIFLLFFYLLGLSLGPLLLGIYANALSDERGKGLSRWTFKLGLQSIYRPAVTFNPVGELTLKKRRYDEKHDHEYVVFGNLLSTVKRYLHDPQDRVHPFFGVPFAFVDELFGTVIDPRDPALGAELHHHQENGVYEYRVEHKGQLHEAVRGVFEIPEGNVGVSLPAVHRLVGGSFSSQVVDAIRDLYETSQSPQDDRSSLWRLMAPVGAFILVALVGSFIAGQGVAGGGGGGGAPAGNQSTISVGASLLLMLIGLGKPSAPKPPRPSLSINWRDVFVTIVSLAVFGGFVAMMLIALGVPYHLFLWTLPLGAWGVLLMLVGLVTLPFVAFWFGRSLGPLGVGLGKLYIILGLLRFDRPVIRFDAGEYGIVEYADHEWATEPSWYRFAFSLVGIAFNNTEANWPNGTTLDRETIDDIRGDVAADGGSVPAPAGHGVTDAISVENIRALLPEKPDPESLYVRTDRTTGWLFDAGRSTRLMQSALQLAKQELGGGKSPMGDSVVLGGILVGVLLGIVFNWLVIF